MRRALRLGTRRLSHAHPPTTSARLLCDTRSARSVRGFVHARLQLTENAREQLQGSHVTGGRRVAFAVILHPLRGFFERPEEGADGSEQPSGITAPASFKGAARLARFTRRALAPGEFLPPLERR